MRRLTTKHWTQLRLNGGCSRLGSTIAAAPAIADGDRQRRRDTSFRRKTQRGAPSSHAGTDSAELRGLRGQPGTRRRLPGRASDFAVLRSRGALCAGPGRSARQ